MILWQGTLGFKQYISSKRRIYGIKLFILCNYRIGFVLDFVIYGSETQTKHDKGLKIAGLVVMSLMQPYFQKDQSIHGQLIHESSSLRRIACKFD